MLFIRLDHGVAIGPFVAIVLNGSRLEAQGLTTLAAVHGAGFWKSDGVHYASLTVDGPLTLAKVSNDVESLALFGPLPSLLIADGVIRHPRTDMPLAKLLDQPECWVLSATGERVSTFRVSSAAGD